MRAPPSVCVLYPTCQWVASLQLTWCVYSHRTSLFFTLNSFCFAIDPVCNILWTGPTFGVAKRSHCVVPCEFLSCSYCTGRPVTSMPFLFSRKISVLGITLVALLQAFTIGTTFTKSASLLSLNRLSNRLRLLLVALKSQTFTVCFDSLTFVIRVAQTMVSVLLVFANFDHRDRDCVQYRHSMQLPSSSNAGPKARHCFPDPLFFALVTLLARITVFKL